MAQARRVRPGEDVLAEDYNALYELAVSLQIKQGRLKGVRDPDGFTPRITVRATTTVTHPLQLTQGGTADAPTITVRPGHVAGIVPTIGGIALDDVTGSGEPPELAVSAADFTPIGLTERALILMRYRLREEDYAVETVEIIAAGRVPEWAPFTFHKLLGTLVRYKGEVTVNQAAFFNQDFDTTDQAKGDFKPWPRLAP